MVAEGSADAAAIDSQVLAIELRDRPGLASQVRTIGALGPSTIQPVVVSASRLTMAERRSIVGALVGIAEDPRARPVMDAAFVDRFVTMDGDGYDDIRGMLRGVQGAGLVGPEWRSRWAALTGPAPTAV